MIEALRKNVESEIDILREIAIFSKRLEVASPAEKKMLSEGMDSLVARMKTTNGSLIGLLDGVQIPIFAGSEKITTKKAPETAQNDKRKMPEPKERMLRSAEREEYLKELSINEGFLKKLKKKQKIEVKEVEEFKKARGYLRLSNKFFLRSADSLIKRGYFEAIPSELKKSNIEVLFEAYVAMMLFSTVIFFMASFVLMSFLLFFNINFGWPLIELYTGNFAMRLLQVFWLPIVIPIATFLVLYYYPSVESGSISKRIDEELPFAVIHMSSISGSGIEPTEIFKIIALSKEYPFLRKEIRKVLNQINIYGYDLVTALNNVSKSTSNQRLAELFAGLATTISSGGELSNFFEKRADTLLVNYKLEKEKAIKVAETSMDIYISVVIAAPMILMLMLVMISVSGIQIGFTPYELTFMTIGGVALINVVFLGYLETKRTLY